MDGYIVQQVLGHGQLRWYLLFWMEHANSRVVYFDPEEPRHRMLIGTIQVSGTSYYIDEYAGMISNSWIQLPTRESGLGLKKWRSCLDGLAANGRAVLCHLFHSIQRLSATSKLAAHIIISMKTMESLRNSWIHNDDVHSLGVDSYEPILFRLETFPKW